MVKLCGNGIFKKEFSTLLPEDFHQLILMIIKSQEGGGTFYIFLTTAAAATTLYSHLDSYQKSVFCKRFWRARVCWPLLRLLPFRKVFSFFTVKGSVK
jgi:hypothetical protein